MIKKPQLDTCTLEWVPVWVVEQVEALQSFKLLEPAVVEGSQLVVGKVELLKAQQEAECCRMYQCQLVSWGGDVDGFSRVIVRLNEVEQSLVGLGLTVQT